MIRPASELDRRKEHHARASASDIFTGPNDGYFGRFNNRDRLYAELRYDF